MHLISKKKTLVSCSYQGNPRLISPGSTETKSGKSFPVTIVASVGSAAILIVVLVLVLFLRKKKPSAVEGICKRDISN